MPDAARARGVEGVSGGETVVFTSFTIGDGYLNLTALGRIVRHRRAVQSAWPSAQCGSVRLTARRSSGSVTGSGARAA
jgi:hypothetical protein